MVPHRRRTQGQAVSTPDLSVLEKLEATANAAWREVYHPSIGRGESINPVTNKERTYIDAVRADQAVAGWYLDHARQIKELIRLSAAQK